MQPTSRSSRFSQSPPKTKEKLPTTQHNTQSGLRTALQTLQTALLSPHLRAENQILQKSSSSSSDPPTHTHIQTNSLPLCGNSLTIPTKTTHSHETPPKTNSSLLLLLLLLLHILWSYCQICFQPCVCCSTHITTTKHPTPLCLPYASNPRDFTKSTTTFPKL
jgi:hypothetical protein